LSPLVLDPAATASEAHATTKVRPPQEQSPLGRNDQVGAVSCKDDFKRCFNNASKGGAQKGGFLPRRTIPRRVRYPKGRHKRVPRKNFHEYPEGRRHTSVGQVLSASQPGTIKICQRLNTLSRVMSSISVGLFRTGFSERRSTGGGDTAKPSPAEQVSKLESTAHAGLHPRETKDEPRGADMSRGRRRF